MVLVERFNRSFKPTSSKVYLQARIKRIPMVSERINGMHAGKAVARKEDQIPDFSTLMIDH